MNETLIGIIAASLIAPALLKTLEWAFARSRARRTERRDDLSFVVDKFGSLFNEWEDLHRTRIETIQARHANQLEDWVNRTRDCRTDTDPECAQVLAEIRAEIARLRIERREA